MADNSYFTEKVTARAAEIMQKTQERLDAYFPTKDLTRRQWKEINQRGEDAIPDFMNLADRYGKTKVAEWVTKNQQRDLEEKA